MSSLLPAQTLIRIHALALLPLSYYLLTSPSTITDHNVVFMLGEAMGLPQPYPSPLSSSSSSTSPHLPASLTASAAAVQPTATSALAALLAVLLAMTDLSAFALPDDQSHFYWRTAVPVRLLFFFGVTGGGYYLGAAEKRAEGLGGKMGMGAEGWRQACGNSLVFTWGFLELVFWFWMFVTLREEGKVRAGKEAVRVREEERRKEGI